MSSSLAVGCFSLNYRSATSSDFDVDSSPKIIGTYERNCNALVAIPGVDEHRYASLGETYFLRRVSACWIADIVCDDLSVKIPSTECDQSVRRSAVNDRWATTKRYLRHLRKRFLSAFRPLTQFRTSKEPPADQQ